MPKVRSGRRSSGSKSKKWVKNHPVMFATVLIVIIIGGALATFLGVQYIQSQNIGQTTAQTNPIYVYWRPRDIQLDDFPLEIYALDEDKFEEAADYDDPDKLRTFSNWEKVASGDAEDISKDFSVYPNSKLLIRLDPDNETDFEHYDKFITVTTSSMPIVLDAYNDPSDVNPKLLTSDLSSITFGNYSTDGNFTFLFNYPKDSYHELPYGGVYPLTTDEYNDLSASEKEDLRNQNLQRMWFPKYNIEDDEDHDYDDPIEKYTNLPAIRFNFNSTINTTDGSTYQVNFTVSDFAYEYEQVVSGSAIYLLITEPIDCTTGIQSFNIEMEIGSANGLNSVETGNVSAPKDEDNLSTFEQLSILS